MRMSLTGRSESVNLQGASEGVFDPADTYVRKTVSSMVSLRNVIAEASYRSIEVVGMTRVLWNSLGRDT